MFSFAILVLGLLAIVIISLKGTAVVRWGKNLIGLGGAKIAGDTEEDDGSETIPESIGVPPATVTIRMPKRGCGDCILIIMGEREKYELKISSVQDKILKNQMNFFEQKMVEIQEIVEKIFNDMMESTKKQTSINALGRNLDIEYKFFTELFKNALLTVKNEIRRSYKENGYYDLSDSDFSIYLKDKSRLVTNLIIQHIKNMYPSQGMVVTHFDLQSGLLSMIPQMHEIIRDCFEYAKEVTLDSEKQVESFKMEFSSWVDRHISEK